MRKCIFIILACSLLHSCKIYSPTFKNLGQWQVSKISGSQVTLSNKAYFYNPNSIDGIKVNGVSVEVQADGRRLGSVNSGESALKIPKLSDFEIPLNVTVNLSDLIGNVGSILTVLTGQSIDVRCIGEVKVGYSLFQRKVSIDQTLPINISDIKKIQL